MRTRTDFLRIVLITASAVASSQLACIALTGVSDFTVDDKFGVDGGKTDVSPEVPDTADAAKTCEVGSVACTDKCVDTQTDNANCGSCGKSCNVDEKCLVGVCQPDCKGLVNCSGKCFDLTKSSTHCGSCTNTCKSDEDCVGSICVPGCAAPTVRCGADCSDTMTDPKHCGTCDKACADTEECVAGTCNIKCTSPMLACGGVCVDPTKDPANCGKCDNKCGGTVPTCVTSLCANTFVFPSTTSTTFRGSSGATAPLGAGGGSMFFQVGDAVFEALPRSTAITHLDISLKMSDFTAGCAVGATQNFNVKVNGVFVGSYAWTNGAPAGDKTIVRSYFFGAIAPDVSGKITVRYEATTLVCSGGGSWNWFAGGSATVR